MADAILILLDHRELPITLAETQLALRALRGVWHVVPLGATEVADVAAIRQDTEARLARLREAPRVPVEVYDDDGA